MRRILRHGLKRLLIGQRGFTFMGLLVTIGLTSVIGSVLVVTFYQMSYFTSRDQAKVATIADLRNSMQWLAKDIQMANTTSLVEEFPTVYDNLTLNWTDQFGGAADAHSAAYSVVGTELRRTYDGFILAVARGVTSVQFSLQGRLITITLTSADDKWTDVTRQFSHYFYLRPSL
ncbi:MAG: type II secretion system protein [Dehalococcoidia bacterium]